MTESSETCNPQARLAEYASKLHYDALPADVGDEAKYRVLDWLGSAMAGVRENPSRVITDLVKKAGGAPQSTVVRGGVKVPVAQAALANGTIGHAAEFDDGHTLAMTHPGAVAVPACLAVAEYAGASGKDLLAGVVAGFEVMIRLGMVVNPSHYKVWHTTGTCGVFASAAAAGRVLKLDGERIRTALGISGTMAAGLQQTFGTHAKPLNAGHACQSGILAALLAQGGFGGPEDILTGRKGFIRATSSETDTAALTERLGDEFSILTAGYKTYASCGHTFAPLNALFLLMEKHDPDAQEIESIDVVTYHVSVDLTGKFKNENAEQAKFSLPYCLAAALLCGKVALAEFSSESLQNPRIARLAAKVNVREDEEMTARFPRDRMATVVIRLKNGRTLEESVVKPQGIPARSMLEKKFLSLARMEVDPYKAEEILGIVLRLQEFAGIDSLMKMLL